jgi:predicted nucleic acid-binding protein
MTTLIDSNVLIDIFGDDSVWYDWSSRQLRDAIVRGSVFINDIIYTESSIRYGSVAQFEDALTLVGIGIASMPRDALFLAGKTFQRYRRAGGPRTGVLPDFLIGAHAAVAGIPLLTRDARRYRNYFPTLELIAPDAP